MVYKQHKCDALCLIFTVHPHLAAEPEGVEGGKGERRTESTTKHCINDFQKQAKSTFKVELVKITL